MKDKHVNIVSLAACLLAIIDNNYSNMSALNGISLAAAMLASVMIVVHMILQKKRG